MANPLYYSLNIQVILGAEFSTTSCSLATPIKGLIASMYTGFSIENIDIDLTMGEGAQFPIASSITNPIDGVTILYKLLVKLTDQQLKMRAKLEQIIAQMR